MVVGGSERRKGKPNLHCQRVTAMDRDEEYRDNATETARRPSSGRATKSLARGLGGVLVGAVYVVLAGLLSIQVIAMQSGAVIDLTNSVVAITSPQLPVLPMLALAALSMLMVYFLATGAQGFRKRRVAFLAGFGAATLLLVVSSFLFAARRAVEVGALSQGLAYGWKGWIEEGGQNSAVHLVLFLSVGALWRALRGHPTFADRTSARSVSATKGPEAE